MSAIDLVVVDIDGVMTDGCKYYDSSGLSTLKTFCDLDFTALKRFKAAGKNVCFLSGDPFNRAMAQNRCIDFYGSKNQNKADLIKSICDIYKTSLENTVYVGDDLFDLDLLKIVGHAYCPLNSCPDILRLPNVRVLPVEGGKGVVAYLFDSLVQSGLVDNVSLSGILSIDKLEIY